MFSQESREAFRDNTGHKVAAWCHVKAFSRPDLYKEFVRGHASVYCAHMLDLAGVPKGIKAYTICQVLELLPRLKQGNSFFF